MDENLHQDNLNDFFKNTFENQADAPDMDGWDTPSSTVWEGVDAHLEEERPRRVLVYWKWAAIAASVLLLATSILLIRACQQTSVLQEQIALENTTTPIKKETVIKTIAETTTTLEKQPTVETIGKENQSNPTTKKPIIIADNKAKTVLKTTTTAVSTAANTELANTNLTTTQNAVVNNKIIKETIFAAEKNNKENGFQIVDNQSVESSSLKGNKTQDSILNPIKSLATAPIKTIDFETKESSEIAFLSNYKAPKQVTKLPAAKGGGHFFAGAYVAPPSSKKISREKGVATNKFEGKIDLKKKNFGLKFGYEWDNGWAFVSGVNIQKNTKNAVRLHRLEYTKFGREDGPNNTFVKEYEVDLNTSLGSISLLVPISESKDLEEYEEGKEIPVALKTNSNWELISIPLLAQYRFGKSKFSCTLKTGLGANFIRNAWVELEEVSPQLMRFGREPIRKKYELKDLKNTSFDWIASAGVQYAINDHWSLDFEPTLRLGLTSILDDSRTNINVKENSMALNAGLTYHF